jgi:GNAT superfamily N-acetyltransferase
MKRLELHPFSADVLDDAGELLAERHRAHRLLEPSLPAAFEQPDAARAAIVGLATADASGAFATRGGAAVGYLLGTPRADSTWGPNIWVEPAGHAVREAEAARDLYAFAATRWVEEGRTSHYAVVPAADPALIDAWFRLGFGQQHVHAIREVPKTPLAEARSGLVIRRTMREDIGALADLDLALPAHQMRSPVFSSVAPPPVEEARAEWDEEFDNPAFATFVAVADGRVVGSAIGCSVEESSLHSGIAQADDAAHLGFAAVLEDARGMGAGTALGATVVDWAATEGYTAVVTDWRATNLLSSRTWPKLGFRQTFLRLFRAIA